MATPGRGRGYSGRHHLRETRPGDEPPEAVRTLAELSPHATAPLPEVNKSSMECKDKEPVELDDADPPEYNPSDDEAVMKKLLHIDEQYSPLLVLLEQFSPGEDGIQFNRKLRQFETTITNLCPDDARLIQVFATFRAASLQNSSLTRKLSGVGASFTRQQKQRALRAALLDVMQDTFARLEVLERSNPLFLINAANLMGDYFAEARLCNGNKVHILASPLIMYMRALLSSDDIRAHRSLATQLMQNGRELLSVLPLELDDLSISIRLRLLSPPPVSIIWLLLSADLCLNRFLPLPNTLQQFYAAHLELTSDDNYSEVSYGSWKKSPEKDFAQDTSQDLGDKTSLNLSQMSLNENGELKPKLRPILGAGAGKLRQDQVNVGQDGYETWTPKSLSKRYDLNSWRQEEEEKPEDTPVFNPTVLPPNMPNFTVPPPNLNRYSYQETYPNYLQQGDGAYIQSQFPINNTNFPPQGDFATQFAERPTSNPERASNETQQSCSRKTSFNAGSGDFIPQPVQTEQLTPVNKEKSSSKQPIENWRKEKSDLNEDANKNRQRNWSRQRSSDDINSEEEKFKSTRASRDSIPGNSRTRQSRRNSADKESGNSGKTPPRRHVSDVPRNNKYWDHDDRCDKDYNS